MKVLLSVIQEWNKLQRQKILIYIYPIYNHNWRNISTIYIYKTRLASKEIFLPSNKINGKQVGLRTYQHPWTHTHTHTHTVFLRCLHIVNGKKPLFSSSVSVCPHVSVRLPLDGFSGNFILGLFRKPVAKLRIWLKSDNNIGHCTWKLKYVYIVESSTKYARQQCEHDPLLRLRGNTERFCIVDSYVCINNNAKGIHCSVSMATVLTRIRHNDTLHIHSLHCC